MTVEIDSRADLSRRLERVAWALFLIMAGGLALVPDSSLPEGTWLVGVGIIMLGLNLARYVNGIRTSGFTIVLGLIALGSGIGDLTGLDLPVLPILLILIGASLLLRAFVPSEQPRS
ncbi:MAG: hypothetical protein ACYC5O_20775 [Anaerolineae bacterium]